MKRTAGEMQNDFSLVSFTSFLILISPIETVKFSNNDKKLKSSFMSTRFTQGTFFDPSIFPTIAILLLYETGS